MGDRGRTASYPAAPSSRRWRDVRNYRTGFLRIIRLGASTLKREDFSAIPCSEVCINSPARLRPVNVSFAQKT